MWAEVITVTLDDVLLPACVSSATVDDARIGRLTRAMQAGDEAAWRELHGLYASRLLRYLLVVTQGSEDHAREALQLTFIRAVRYCRPFDQESSLWSWLTRLARCVVTDEHRKSARYLRFLSRWFEQRVSIPEVDEAENRLLAMLQLELDGLPPDDRALIAGKYFAGVRVRDLAGQLDTTDKAIESRLVRLRRRLKEGVLARLRQESHD